ncbi:MAG: hypothetical protein RLZ98_1004 [Pseudomonadota bacterium]|jgi:uncharacterized membrane protein YkoI
MKANINAPAALVAIALLLPASAAAPAAASQSLACYADWSAAAPVAHREGLIPLDRLTVQVATKHDGKLLKAVLCKTPETYVYRVVVKKGNGRLGTHIINARP